MVIGEPLAYANASYDVGYNAAKFDFLHYKSYNGSFYTYCTRYRLGDSSMEYVKWLVRKSLSQLPENETPVL